MILAKMKPLFKKTILLFSFILLALSISYWPALLINYAYHDDYRFWENLPGAFTLHPFHLDNIIYGRFISSYLLTFAGWFVTHAGDLNVLRFVNILQLSVCAVILTRLLEKYFQDKTLPAALTAVMIFTLPPFQVMVSYASYFYLPFTVLLALTAAALVKKVPPTRSIWEFIFDLRAVSAILCLFCGLSAYASAAMFYWTSAACIIMSSGSRPPKEKMVSAGQLFYVGFAAMIIYALFLQWTKKFYSAYVFQMYDPYQTATDYGNKLIWFIGEPVYNSLNLWNIFPTVKTAIPVIFLIFSGCLLSIFRTIKARQTPAGLFLNLILFTTLFILNFLPNLLAKGNAAFYRCSAGLMALIVIAAIWALREWLAPCPEPAKKIILTTVLIAECVYGITQAQSTVLNFQARPNHAELNYIKDILQKTDISKYSRIHLILPATDSRRSRYDEFGKISTSFSQDFRGILACASREIGKEDQLYRYHILRSVSAEDKTSKDFHEPTLIIDMRKLAVHQKISE